MIFSFFLSTTTGRSIAGAVIVALTLWGGLKLRDHYRDQVAQAKAEKAVSDTTLEVEQNVREAEKQIHSLDDDGLADYFRTGRLRREDPGHRPAPVKRPAQPGKHDAGP